MKWPWNFHFILDLWFICRKLVLLWFCRTIDSLIIGYAKGKLPCFFGDTELFMDVVSFFWSCMLKAKSLWFISVIFQVQSNNQCALRISGVDSWRHGGKCYDCRHDFSFEPTISIHLSHMLVDKKPCEVYHLRALWIQLLPQEPTHWEERGTNQGT